MARRTLTLNAYVDYEPHYRPRSVLTLFSKRPVLGYGKQRLAAQIGKGNALRIAEGLLACALEDAAVWQDDLVLAPSDPSESDWAQTLTQSELFDDRDVRVEVQSSGNLGDRLRDMDTRLRVYGNERVIFMASDAPSLNPGHFENVIAELERHDVVLADDTDGGVTLMASRTRWPALDKLPWSTEGLGDSLAEACRAAGLSVTRLNGGFDVDNQVDLFRLVAHLRNDMRPARRSLLRIVKNVLENMT